MTRTGKGSLSFERDGPDWPHREFSTFVQAAGIRWHVQVMGQGPTMLLLHGTGASTHTWRDLAPLLARDFTLIMPDLPGHGFTGAIDRARLSLPGIARALSALLQQTGHLPGIVVGHSAGAAILAHLVIANAIAPRCLISINGAFLPFEGLAGVLFPPLAKLMFLNPFTPRMLAWSADAGAVARLIRGTGSKIDSRGIDLYRRLLASADHIAGTLGMMANWDLDTLSRQLGKLTLPVLLLAGSADRAVPPESASKVGARIPAARIERLAGLGHLAHEEAPQQIADLIARFTGEDAFAQPGRNGVDKI